MTDNYNEAEQLLPWYVNGTLNKEQRTKVEAWLKNNKTAVQEKQMLEQLQQKMQQENKLKGPGEFGWRRLQKQIRQQSALQKNKWYRPALAAAVALIMVQSGLLVYNIQEKTDTTQWQTLSGETTQQPILQIIFQPQATEEQIRNLLQKNRLTIVEGPSAVGLYRLQLTRGGQQNLQKTAELLLKHNTIVRHAVVE